jgi:hypothetical protein
MQRDTTITVCGKAGSINTDTRALVPQRCGRIAMIIPHRLLRPEALRGVIEAFVTRDGTDYGAQEVPLATKIFPLNLSGFVAKEKRAKELSIFALYARVVTRGDTQPCPCPHTSPNSSMPTSVMPISIRYGGRIVRSTVLGVRVRTWAPGGPTISGQGVSATGAKAVGARSTT